jgi:hypothetical protein
MHGVLPLNNQQSHMVVKKKNMLLLYDSVSVDAHLNVELVIRFVVYFNSITLACTTDSIQGLSVMHTSYSHVRKLSLECKRMHPCFILTTNRERG